MSVYSTKYITREQAIAVIVNALSAASDQTIAGILFDLVGCEGAPIGHSGYRLCDFKIVDDPSDYDEDEPEEEEDEEE